MTRTSLSARTRFEVLKRDGFTCQYCGRSRDQDGVKLHVDHVIAVAEGGTDDPVNLVAACAECNLGKSDKPLAARAPVPDIEAQSVELASRRAKLLELQERSRAVADAEYSAVLGPNNYWFEAWGYESMPKYNVPHDKTLLRYVEAIGVAEVIHAIDITVRKFDGRLTYGVVAYFCGVCKRKVAEREGRVVVCVECNGWIVLSPELAASTPDRDSWAHGGECSEARKARLEKLRDIDDEICPRCGGPMHPGLWYCSECKDASQGDEIAVEVAAWDQLAEAAGF